MLLFVAREPNAANEKDGMTQRVQWIDKRFENTPRTILSVAYRRHLRRRRIVRSKTLVIEEMNAFLHIFQICLLVWRSEATYVHSCYNALHILPAYFFRKHIVTDMHGVVPEEESSQGNIWRSRVLRVVERIVLIRSSALVFVTAAMKEHFQAKYPSSGNVITYVVPILPERSPCMNPRQREADLVIYAGGLQAWQQVDRMLDAAGSMEGSYRLLFLTGTPQLVRQKIEDCALHNVEVDSVPKSQISEHYQRASFGFLLREDSIVNRVACPTKLVEYLLEGVVPIVEQALVGDFAALGYRYVLLRDFLNNTVPSHLDLENWRRDNEKVVSALESTTIREFERLKRSLVSLTTLT